MRDNTGLTPKGLVQFWTDDNRDAIEATLKRPGFALRIGPEDRISEPFRADGELLRRIYQAFVPVVPEGDGGALEYAGNALGDSGQGAQEGETYQQEAENRNDDNDEQTEQRPEEEEEPQMPPPPDPMIEVGDILPLALLEDFAGMQQAPDGHILALASAQLFQDDGSGPVLVEEGLSIVQIEIDWATRTIAPTGLASFVQFDPSSDPNDLSVIDPATFQFPPEFFDAYNDALVNSVEIAFGSGGNSLAVFDAPLFTFTIRQGAGDTVTVDVDVDFSTNDGQGGTLNLVSTFQDLLVMPGPGELLYGITSLSQTLSIADLEAAGATRNQTITMTGGTGAGGVGFVAANNVTELLFGTGYAQLEVNFGNRTVGGSNSFLAVTVPPDPAFGGAQIFEYIPLDQPVSFDVGFFGKALFPAPRLTSNPSLTHGQVSFLNLQRLLAVVNVLLDVGANDNLYTSFGLGESDSDVFPLSTIAGLEGLAGTLGAGNFFYDSTADVSGINAVSFFFDGTNGASGDAEMQIDINFANRTLGGGMSYVSVDIDDSLAGITVQFTELLNAVSFDDAASGMGAFAFDGSDFSGSNMESMLLLIRDGLNGPGETADAHFRFTDAGSGEGEGLITGVPLGQGSSSPPSP